MTYNGWYAIKPNQTKLTIEHNTNSIIHLLVSHDKSTV